MCVEATRTLLSTNEPQREQRYYIASLITTSLDFNQIVRAHWGFENKAHWSLDVIFGEDLRTRQDKRRKTSVSLSKLPSTS
ncbi:transposase [Arachidicoccus soli]|uniref:transposase n=1 Tax=Arachidicoccus soli TaxID=2341117 RepID=UPI0013C4A79C|nr:transposase [Arachidicoccus soli]